MREPPPAHLSALLSRLGLATDRDLESVETNVRRMAGDLPRFESVWIDALRQARLLTHFQAAEIHAGRGESLKIGRYVLCQPVQECGFAAIYRAEDRQTREIVRLVVFPLSSEDMNALLPQLDKLIATGKGLPAYAGLIAAAGSDGSLVWASSPWLDGTSLADWMLHHGRFPPEAVLEIARAMLGGLIALEAAGLVHGDIRAHNILIAKDGEVFLPHPGLRGLIRPNEGLSHHDLAPDACSTLAPERVGAAIPPNVASDLFACGCVWWHMLCGRPPLGGGDALTRLRAAQAASVNDLQQWAADVPDPLVEAIHECLQKDPEKRPRSMADLAGRLGPLRRRGRQAIAHCLAVAELPRAPWLRSKRSHAKKKTHPHRFTAAALMILAAAAVAWPVWVARNRPQARTSIATQGDSPGTKPRAGGMVGGVSHTLPDLEKPREPVTRSIVDAAVTPASYAANENAAGQIGSRSNESREEIRLPTDRPVRGESLQFKPGERVHAQGGRARIVVPRAGLAVQADRLTFENIDFVTEEDTNQRAIRDEGSPALIRLLAAECGFTNCSFQSAAGSPELSAGIVWEHASAGRMKNSVRQADHGMVPEPALSASLDLPAGRVRIKNCVFRRVGVGVESAVHGAIGLEFLNCLHLGPGPLIRLAHAPAADEPVRVALAQVTLREADALVECHCTGSDDHSGEIGIAASGCVLAPRAQAALLILTSETFPQRLLRNVKWTGQGSVVAGQVTFGRWSRSDEVRQAIDDSTISISGLVRGEVEFAARFDGVPASSQVLNCQAPLQDTDSAGAAVQALPPEVKP